MISVTCDQAWPTYHVWPISKCFMLGWSCGVWPACCHWLNTGMTDGRCPIMFMFTQKSYPCDTWFVCSTLRDLAVSNLGQLLFYLSITWSRCRNAFRDLWTLTIQWRHQAITWSNVDLSSVSSSDIYLRLISQELPTSAINCLKIAYLKFHSNRPGDYESILNVLNGKKWHRYQPNCESMYSSSVQCIIGHECTIIMTYLQKSIDLVAKIHISY